MREVDDIDGYVVLLESHTHILKVVLGAFQWRPDEHNDPLPLCLVLSVLQGQLSNLDSFQAVRIPV